MLWRALFFVLLPGVAVLLAGARSAPQEEQTNSAFSQSFKGKLLVAAPQLKGNVFERSVIFIVGHDAQGAFGLIVNKPVRSVPRGKVFGGLGTSGAEGTGDFTIFYGGPVSPNTGFVIHDGLLKGDAARHVVKDFAVSDQKFIVEALARVAGPDCNLFIVGYAGWAAGQLESELRRGDWVTAPLDRSIVYDKVNGTKWKRAMERRFHNL